MSYHTDSFSLFDFESKAADFDPSQRLRGGSPRVVHWGPYNTAFRNKSNSQLHRTHPNVLTDEDFRVARQIAQQEQQSVADYLNDLVRRRTRNQ